MIEAGLDNRVRQGPPLALDDRLTLDPSEGGDTAGQIGPTEDASMSKYRTVWVWSVQGRWTSRLRSRPKTMTGMPFVRLCTTLCARPRQHETVK